MGSVQRGLITRDDVAHWDGVTRTSSRTDATGGTVSGLNFGDEVDILQVFGSGTSRSVATITTAIGRLGGANATFLFSTGTWTIDADLTIPSNVSCHVPAGTVFDVASGKTLTISGLVFSESGTWTSGAGTIVGGERNGFIIGRTAAEISASVTPTNYQYEPGNVLRYGAVADGDGAGGGTDNATAFQAAANADENIYIPKGNYRLDSLITIDSDTKIYGDGFASFVDATNITTTYTFQAIQESNVHFRDLRIKFDNTTDGPTPIRLDGCTDCSIDHVLIDADDNGASPKNIVCIGIKSNSNVASKRITVTDCVLKSPGLCLIVQNSGTDTAKDITINGNIIVGTSTNAAALAYQTGLIKVDLNCDNVTIVGNTVTGNSSATRAGIQCEEGVSNITITGNAIRDCAEWGIKIFDGQGSVTVDNVVINGNSLLACGISYEPNLLSAGFKSVSICGNVITDSFNDGIDAENVNSTEGIVIANNAIHNPTAHGIITRGKHAVITGNSIYDAGDRGIWLRSSCDYAIVSNNTIVDTAAAGWSIQLTDSDFVSITGNTIKNANTTTAGEIVDGGTCTDVLITGNVIDTAGAYCVFVDATSPVRWIIDNNILNGATTANLGGGDLSTQRVRGNAGWVTENSGTGSITSGGTTDVITHGLAVTPTAADIRVTLTEDPSNTPGAIFVNTITSTQFTVNCENDPGASNLDFEWQAIVL